MKKFESELYALTHRGNPGDRAFYAKSCAKARRVLELGTGYGRLIPSLLVNDASEAQPAPTREVWGLERDPQMLAAARRATLELMPAQRKQVKLVAGDMSNFALEQTFDRILLPYNGLYCLLNRRDIIRCFRCVKRHLAPGGEFIFDVWAADGFHENARASEYHDDTDPILTVVHGPSTTPRSGRRTTTPRRRCAQTWDVYEKSRLRSNAQRLDVTYTYVSRESGTVLTIPIAQRYAPSSELTELVERAGLRVKALYGNFAKRRFARNSPFLIVKAA